MKDIVKKITNVLSVVYGWGIMLALFLGGLTFFGYLAAFIVGGDLAAAISKFIYKSFFPIIIYAANTIVVLGLVIMYLRGEKTLVIKDDKGKVSGPNC